MVFSRPLLPKTPSRREQPCVPSHWVEMEDLSLVSGLPWVLQAGRVTLGQGTQSTGLACRC